MAKKLIALAMALLLTVGMFAACAKPAADAATEPAAAEAAAPAEEAAATEPEVNKEEVYVFMTPLMSLEYFQQHKHAVEDAAAGVGTGIDGEGGGSGRCVRSARFP